MFSDEEKTYLKEIYKGRTCQEIANMINEKFNSNHSAKAVEGFKNRNKLRSEINCQFKKGTVPHNKGKKWDEYLTPEQQDKSRQTCFKKGNIPKGHREIGSERIVEGKIKVKIAEPKAWEYKHRLIYEKAYGKIPKGMNVIFADGNTFNLELDNLLLVSDNELLRLNKNKLIKENKDLTKSGLALVKLMNKMREVEKTNE